MPGGYVVFGKAEMLLGRAPGFVPVDLKSRVFRRASHEAVLDRLGAADSLTKDDMPANDSSRLRELAIESDPNRRLQEELKRSNQELETAYEELHWANTELSVRGDELNRSNSFLETIGTGPKSAGTSTPP